MSLTFHPEYEFARPVGFIPGVRRLDEPVFAIGTFGASPREFRQLEIFPNHFQRATEDQRQTSSCTGNAAIVLLEFSHYEQKQTWADFSRMYPYALGRQMRGWLNSDGGAVISDVFWVLGNQGCPLEPYWMFKESLLFTAPDQRAMTQARRHRLVNPRRVPRTALKEVLSGGGDPTKARPVVIGFSVYQSRVFAPNVVNTGWIDLPASGSNDFVGGHAIALTGYNEQEDWYEFPNSWGTGWGRSSVSGRPGWGRIHGQYLRDPNLSSDFWTGDYLEIEV